MLIERFFFYVFVFCLPFQTRKILYQWSSFNEWSSIYLYFTDVLVLSIFLLWYLRNRKERFFRQGIFPKSFDVLKSANFWLVAFLFVAFVSLVQTDNIGLGFYHWFKMLEFAILFFYLKYNFGSLFSFGRLSQVIILSGLFQSVIAIGQYTFQKSLGLRFLTESPLSPDIAGVAKIIPEGLKIIRAYGTFPHPNLLAVFLIISIFSLYYIWLRKPHSFDKSCVLFFFLGLMFFALWLTFSRTAIIAFLASSLIYFLFALWQTIQTTNKGLFKRILLVFLALAIFYFLFVSLIQPETSERFQISLADPAVSLRGFYNQMALDVISNHPWLGLGMGNFVWQMRQALNLLASWTHQPVHNLYLLIASEVGLIGLVIFLFFVFKIWFSRQKSETDNLLVRGSLFIIISSFLLMALFDHFFWSLQQGQLMFWLILGLMASGISQKEKPLE